MMADVDAKEQHAFGKLPGVKFTPFCLLLHRY